MESGAHSHPTQANSWRAPHARQCCHLFFSRKGKFTGEGLLLAHCTCCPTWQAFLAHNKLGPGALATSTPQLDEGGGTSSTSQPTEPPPSPSWPQDRQQILQKRYADVDSTAAGFLVCLHLSMPVPASTCARVHVRHSTGTLRRPWWLR